MSESSGDNLIVSVERLVRKMEKMYERQLSENDKLEKMLTSLDSLSKVLERWETEKSFENEFNRKIELIDDALQRVLNNQAKIAEEEKTLDKIFQGAKTFGQILSAVATGIQYSVDGVGSVLKKDEEVSRAQSRSVSTQTDLAMLLQPLNALVKNIAEEKKKSEQKGAGKSLENEKV
ncbi:MAG: hypothetical protein ACOY46_12305 [Bacillota bacterium]